VAAQGGLERGGAVCELLQNTLGAVAMRDGMEPRSGLKEGPLIWSWWNLWWDMGDLKRLILVKHSMAVVVLVYAPPEPHRYVSVSMRAGWNAHH
jgi:hypothetical protein